MPPKCWGYRYKPLGLVAQCREFAITEAIFLNDVRVVGSGNIFDPCKWRSVLAQKAVVAVLVKEGQNYKTILKGVINLLRVKENSEVEGLRKDI